VSDVLGGAKVFNDVVKVAVVSVGGVAASGAGE